MIPRPMMLIGIVVLLWAWFLLVERQSFLEKIGIMTGLMFIYVAFRLITGANVDQILAPFLQQTYF